MQLNKKNKLALQINLILAASCYSAVAESAPLDINQLPLAGVTLSYAPNLVLALSVEFPTAGPAYSTLRGQGGKEIIYNQDLNKLYRGYFDPKKCYTYNGQHFTPVGKSIDRGGKMGLCPARDQFSGSIMNVMTASALDVFRQTLTGGNRAYGEGVDPTAYEKGDTVSETFVRRSQPGKNKNDPQHSTMRERRIDLAGASEQQILDLFPQEYIQPLKDIIERKAPSASAGLPSLYGYRKLTDIKNGPQANDPLVGSDAEFADHKLYFTNTGFGAFAFRKLASGQYAYAPNMQYPAIVVQVCKPGFLEENCKEYNGHYKPEGLLQRYGREGMRVATFGYLNDNSYTGDAPVLRSRMKYLDRTEKVAGITYGQEWDPDTGQFIVNPDVTDASASGVTNSGVINYVNKFGDAAGYKSFDIGAELYYAALRYLRGGENGNFGSMGLSTQRAAYVRNNADEVMKDGFPAIYNWDDPILRGLGSSVAEAAKNPQAQCRTSSIIYIGDTNTHNDQNLPHFGGKKYLHGNNNDMSTTSFTAVRDNIRTQSYLRALLENEGLGENTWNQQRGSTHSFSGMAGLAYWARVNDIRSDIPGLQSGSNFIIDVVENGDYKGQNNTYWLAAKYGGFKLSEASDYSFDGQSFKMPRDQRTSWTDDAPNTSSIPEFFGGGSAAYQGIPRNFGVANNPDSMKDSLEKAFASAGEFDNPGQAEISFSVPADEKVDLDAGALIVSSTFDATKLTGDLILSRFKAVAGSANVDIQEQWRASAKLNAAYHNLNNSWSKRSVFAKNGNSISLLKDITLPGSDSASLVSYTLGSKKDEGSLWRKRESLIGSAVYGAPVSILKPQNQNLGNCAFDSAAMNREVHYAVATNEGMFHIFDSDGDEKMAYIPGTLLPRLRDYAAIDAKHQFMNDGSAVYADTCFGNVAKSVVVANTGRGSSAVYALDVTNLSVPSADKVLWEFSSADDPDLGLTVGKVSISKNADGKPIAIFSSGLNNASEKGYLFILDISNTGSWVLNNNYWKVALGSGTVQGVGEPFVYDDDIDGVADNVYVGDYNGKLWRVDHDSANNGWQVANGGSAMFTPLPAEAAPITGSPFVQKVRGKIYVAFGTGQYINDDGLSPTVQNYAYGLIDDGNASSITPGEILTQTIKTVVTTFAPVAGKDTRELWAISEEEFDESTHRGWRLQLQKGQTIVAQPNIRGGEVAEYVAVNRGSSADNICAIEGATSIISISLRNGGSYPKPLFDTSGDGVVDDNDKLGGMVTIIGQIAPYLKGVEATANNQKTYVYAGFSETGPITQHGKVFGEGSVMIRVTHREVPL